MTRNLTFTLYASARTNQGHPIFKPWEQWVELFKGHEVRGDPGDSSDKRRLDKAKDRLRVVLPLVEPIEPSDFADAWSGLNRMIGGVNDPQTKDIGRLHFLPSTFDSGHAHAWRHEGRWMSLNDIPSPAGEMPITAGTMDDATKASEIRDGLVRMRTTNSLKDAAKALAGGHSFANPGDRHDKIVGLTWTLAKRDRRVSGPGI